MNVKSVLSTAATGLLVFALIGLGGATTTFAATDEVVTETSEFTQVQSDEPQSDVPQEVIEVTKPATDDQQDAAQAASTEEVVEEVTTEVTEGAGSVPQAPAAPSGTGGTLNLSNAAANSNAAGAINTSSRASVQKAFEEQYLANNVNVPMSNNANVETCEHGQANPIGGNAVVSALNMMRSLNGLERVSLDTASSLSDVAQTTALGQAAYNHGKDYTQRTLSHHPKLDGFTKCMDTVADKGAGTSLLSESLGQTPAQQVLWFVQDYSPASNPINDKLGHRLNLFDPFMARTAVGYVEGYTSIMLPRTQVYGDYVIDSTAQFNMANVAPETITWPAKGYFPQQLLTAKDSGDSERWSISIKGLTNSGPDLRNVTATLTGPNGRIPATVYATGQSGSHLPDKMRNYGTVALKFSPSALAKVSGTSEATYTVTVSGVRGANHDTYTYQVKLFDGMVSSTTTAPKVFVQHDVVALGANNQFIADTPAVATGNPAPAISWQRSDDNGQTWKDVQSGNILKITNLTGSEVATDDTLFRAKATNSAGTTYSDPATTSVLKMSVTRPALIQPGRDYQMTVNTNFNGNNYWFKVDNKQWKGRFQNSRGQWVNAPFNASNGNSGDFYGGNTATLTIKSPAAGKRYAVTPMVKISIASYSGYAGYWMNGSTIGLTVK